MSIKGLDLGLRSVVLGKLTRVETSGINHMRFNQEVRIAMAF
jgi:hypothetical protein